MKKLVLIALLLFAWTAKAQTTAVTATVTDSDSIVWQQFSFSVFFQGTPGYSGQYTYQGVPFNPQTYSGVASIGGTMNVTLPDNNFISPAGTKWQFILQPYASGQSTQFILPVTGGSQNFTTLFSTGVKPPRFSANSNVYGYADVEVTPTPNPGGFYYNVVTPCFRQWTGTAWTCLSPSSGGGITWSTVAGLPPTPTLNQTAGVTDGNGASCTSGGGSTQVICRWTGTNWIVVSSSVTGSGCVVSGSTNSLQKNNGISGCSGSVVLDSGTLLTVPEDSANQGPSLPTDCRLFGCRAVNPNQVPKGTATCNGTTALAVSGINFPFQNLDGITVPGCGPAPTMTAPTIISVTPVHPTDALNTGHVVADTSGSATVCFEISGRDTAWGMTAASSQVCTTQAAATLGQVSLTLSGCLRVLATTTCTTSSALGFTTGTRVYINGTSDDAEGFGGFPAKANVIDTTHFSFTNGMNTLNGGAPSTVGGSVKWENGVQVLMSPTTAGVYEDIVYETSPTAQLLGHTFPLGLQNGYSDPSYLSYTYWGGTISQPDTMPYWVPTTPPASAVNDNLSTTICSGANGTSSATWTMCAAATQSTTSTAVLDNTPTALLAKTSVDANGGVIYFPPQGFNAYVFNSYLNTGNTGIDFAAPLVLNDTIQTNGQIRGNLYQNAQVCQQPSFALSCQIPITVAAAYPGIQTNSGQMHGATITSAAGNYLLVLDTTSQTGYYSDINFQGSSGADYLGLLYVSWGNTGGTFGGKFERISYITGPNAATNGASTACAMWFRNNTEFKLDYFSAARRSLCFQVPDFGLSATFDHGQEIQGLIAPEVVFMRNHSGTALVQFNLKNSTLDTSASAFAANWQSTGNLNINLNIENVNAPSSGQAALTGAAFAGVNMVGYAMLPSQLGQNTNIHPVNGLPATIIDGYFSSFGQGAQFTPKYEYGPVVMGAANPVYSDQVAQAAPTCTVIPTSGTPISIGTHSLDLHPLYYNGSSTGGEGRSSFGCSFTTTTGNQTVQVTPGSTLPGITGYDPYVDGFLSKVGTCTPPILPISTTFPVNVTGDTCGNSETTAPGYGPAGFVGNGSYNYLTSSYVFNARPSTSVPADQGGVRMFDISTDNWPAFSVAGTSAKTFFMGFPSTGTWTPGFCAVSLSTPYQFNVQSCPQLGSIMTTLGDMIYENAVPTPARLPGPTGPNGVPQGLVNIPAGGAAAAETWSLFGVPVNNNGETTCAAITLNVLDRASNIRCSGGTTSTITFPVHTTLGFATNFSADIYNQNNGNMTLQTTSPDTIDGGSAGGTQTVIPGWDAHLRQDVNGNWYTTRVPTNSAFNGGTNCGDATHGLNIIGGVIGCQSISGSGLTVQTNGTNNLSQTTLNLQNSSPFNGLTFTFTNGSAGNVQAGFSGTLGNAGLTNSTVGVNGVTIALGGSSTAVPPDNAGFTDATNSTATSLVNIATSPTAGHYLLSYYMDLNSTCPSGSDAWNLLFQWIDASGTTRTLQTGNMAAGTVQLSSSYLSGVFDIWVGSGNVSVTPAQVGACASGNSTYDLHTTLTGKLR